jgi:hypothetical protein
MVDVLSRNSLLLMLNSLYSQALISDFLISAMFSRIMAEAGLALIFAKLVWVCQATWDYRILCERVPSCKGNYIYQDFRKGPCEWAKL